MNRIYAIAAIVALWAGTGAGQSGGAVGGSVADVEGAAVPGALVILLPLDGNGVSVELETGTDGRFDHSDVAPGFYTATAAQGDRRSDVYRIQVREGRSVEVSFVVATGAQAGARLASDGEQRDLDTLFAAGVAADQDGRHAEAITYYTLAAQLYPNCIECHYNTGIAYRALAQLQDAERAFNSALTVRREYPAAWYGLASVYTMQGRSEEAAAARTEAASLTLSAMAANRERAVATVERGVLLRDAGNLADARDRFEEATTHDAAYGPAYYWLGVTLGELGLPRDARRALQRYLSIDPDGAHVEAARDQLAGLERGR